MDVIYSISGYHKAVKTVCQVLSVHIVATLQLVAVSIVVLKLQLLKRYVFVMDVLFVQSSSVVFMTVKMVTLLILTVFLGIKLVYLPTVGPLIFNLKVLVEVISKDTMDITMKEEDFAQGNVL